MNLKKDFNEEEWRNRVNLAACYHLADHFQMTDIIWNHITAKTSEQKETFLINQFGLRYDEVTASNLLEIDLEGNIVSGEGDINYTGYIIHGAVHKARKEINCVMHTYKSRFGYFLFKRWIKPIFQDAAIFHNRVSYHDWQGMSTEVEECKDIAKNLGKIKL